MTKKREPEEERELEIAPSCEFEVVEWVPEQALAPAPMSPTAQSRYEEHLRRINQGGK